MKRGLVDRAVVDAVRASSEISVVSLLETVAFTAVQGGDDRSAEELYLAAVEAGSTKPGVLYNLGNIAGRRGRAAEAIAYYSRAVTLDPDLAIAYYNRGVQRRKVGDESGAVADIAAAIELGYSNIDSFAALLRGYLGVLGEPGDSLEHATMSRQYFESGDATTALELADLHTRDRRARASHGGLPERLALFIALQNEMELRQRGGDLPRASAIASELASLCGELALVEIAEWADGLEVLRAFAVDLLPRRLTAMIELHAQAGRHDAALTAATEAINSHGGAQSPQPLPLYQALQNAIYITIRKRARAAVESQSPAS